MLEELHQLEETQLERKFDLIQRGDYISPGWWHWRCRCETSDGDVSYGYVEADSLGKNIGAETFEKDKR